VVGRGCNKKGQQSEEQQRGQDFIQRDRITGYMRLTGVGAVFREEVQPHSLVNVFVSRIVNREIYNEYGLEIVEIDEVNKDCIQQS